MEEHAVQPIAAREILQDSSALLEGHFKLTSGKHSPFYVQCAQLFARPELATQAAKELAERIGYLDVDCTLAPAMGGVIAGYQLAAALRCRALFAERPTGQFELRRGFTLSPGEKVLVIEDVITTGGSALETGRLVQELGAQVVGYASFINRSGGAFDPPEGYWAWATVDAPVYEPDVCPLCEAGGEPTKPGSRPETEK